MRREGSAGTGSDPEPAFALQRADRRGWNRVTLTKPSNCNLDDPFKRWSHSTPRRLQRRSAGHRDWHLVDGRALGAGLRAGASGMGSARAARNSSARSSPSGARTKASSSTTSRRANRLNRHPSGARPQDALLGLPRPKRQEAGHISHIDFVTCSSSRPAGYCAQLRDSSPRGTFRVRQSGPGRMRSSAPSSSSVRTYRYPSGPWRTSRTRSPMVSFSSPTICVPFS